VRQKIAATIHADRGRLFTNTLLIDPAGNHIHVAPTEKDQPTYPNGITVVHTVQVMQVSAWLPEDSHVCGS
jgi:hypothetical protein